MNKKFICALALLIAAPLAFGHLDSGMDKESNGYIIDFGYSPANITKLEPAFLAFNLINSSKKEVIKPKSLWVRISKNEKVYFSGEFYPRSKHISFIYTFVEDGVHEIKLRFFLEDNQEILETFKVKVLSNKSKKYSALSFLSILALIAIIAFKFIKNPKNKRR